jgi:hypothetical protein
LGTLLDSGVLIPGLALCFVFYVAYLLFAARNFVPMTREEAETLWKFHKLKDGCKAKTWHEITKENDLIGFQCECGFRQIQKKPLITIG